MTDLNPNRGNKKFVDESFEDRLKLVEKSFKTVLDSNEHEDNKAGRILSAMAFLTAAAAGIFNIAHSSGPSTTTLKLMFGPIKLIDPISMPVVFFAAYIFFVLLGTAFYLTALGPTFHWPQQTSKKGVKPEAPVSLLFFKKISEFGAGNWKNYWSNEGITLKQRQDLLINNYIDECLYIAQKEDTKVKLMKWGSLCFKISILFLVALAVTLFSPNNVMIWVYIPLGSIGIILYFVIVRWTKPPKEKSTNAHSITLTTNSNDAILNANSNDATLTANANSITLTTNANSISTNANSITLTVNDAKVINNSNSITLTTNTNSTTLTAHDVKATKNTNSITLTANSNSITLTTNATNTTFATNVNDTTPNTNTTNVNDTTPNTNTTDDTTPQKE